MSRLDYKKGRFSMDYETNEIRDALTGYQIEVGDFVIYYRYDSINSRLHSVYDEPIAGGLAWRRPINLPVIHAIHLENERDITAEGEYTNDTIELTASFEQLRMSAMSKLDINTQNYLNDRFVYDGKVFKVIQISIKGQIQSRDLIVRIEGTQVKADELVNSTTFARYAQP